MRNTVIAFFLILAAIVVTKAQPSRGADDAALCSVSPQRPQTQGGQVIAAAEFRCGAPGPDALMVAVHLQRNDGGTWTTVSGQAFTMKAADTTGGDRTRRVGIGCGGGGGNYRTQVDVSVTDNGQTRRFSRSSGEKRNPCG